MVKPSCPLKSTSHRITAVSKTEIVLYGEEVSESRKVEKNPIKLSVLKATKKHL